MKFVVSIIIPTFQRSRELLIRSINSVLCQTYKEIEVIVVDDNLPDSTFRLQNRALIEEYSTDNRVKYIENTTNLGCALARNEGIKYSSGDFITFLDDDDVYLPEKVNKQLSFIVKNKLDMCFMDLMLCNEHNKLLDYRSFENIKFFGLEYLWKYHIMRHITGTDTFMYRKDALVKIGGFDNIIIGDEFYLLLKTIENGFKIGYLKAAYVIAYIHRCDGLSTGKGKIFGENSLYRYKKSQFSHFNIRERMFIRFRHYIVLAITTIRNRKYLSAIHYCIIAFFVSPLDFIIEPIILIRKVLKNQSRI